MSPVPPQRALYLDAGGHGVAGVFHDAPRSEGGEVTGVVLCPPFGWEAMCSHRSRRRWAELLAASGTPALRIEYPGSGDSTGDPTDAGIFDTWPAGVDVAVRWLRTEAGCERVAVVGIEVGGLVAVRAIASGTPADDLVLWNVPAAGGRLVRTLRAFARFEASPPPPADLAPKAVVPDGALMAGGYFMSAETVAALEALDLATLAPDLPAGLRVLALSRDDLAPDAPLIAALDASPAHLETGRGLGYAAMTAEPVDAVPPLETIAAVGAWLASAPPTAGAPPGPAVASHESVTLPGGGRETPIVVEHPAGRLFGVLTEPAGERRELCAVLLNAGALTHAGPNRMWVEAGRRWAELGVPSLRLDVEGIGEADGDETRYEDVGAFYLDELVPQVIAALDRLAVAGMPERFVLLGLCSGAYWAFHAARRDRRIVAAALVNPRALLWDEEIRTLQEVRKIRKLLRPAMWRKLLDPRRSTTSPRVVLRALGDLARRRLRRLRDRLAGRAPEPAGIDYAPYFAQLSGYGTRVSFIFTGGEPLYEELQRGGYVARLAQWPALDVHLLADAPETHTLRPLWCQHGVHARLDAVIARELSA